MSALPAVVAAKAVACGLAVSAPLPSYDAALAFADAALAAAPAAVLDIRLASGSPVSPESARSFVVWVRVP
jgi:hypothetical protein